MPTVFLEDFETDGNGTRYVTSIPETILSSDQYFTRTNDRAPTSIFGAFGNTDGFWFGACDFDGNGNSTQSETMTFTGIDISGFLDLNFSGSFAAFFNFNGYWDSDTLVYFEASIDGGAFEKIMQFAAVPAKDTLNDKNNREAAIDEDLDGVGDGAVLSADFATFSTAFSGTGTTLDLRVTFQNLTQTGEDFQLDTLEITGTRLAPDAVDDLNTSGESELVNLDLLANDTDDQGDPVTIISGGGNGVQMPMLVTSAGGRQGTAIFFSEGDLNFAFDPLGNFLDLGLGETDTVTISYTVTDGTGETDTADVVLTIEGESDVIRGDENDNMLVGTTGNDFIIGEGGNDTINGQGGDDRMVGGTGDDHYYVDDAGDVIVEAAGEGYEYVNTTITWTLDENVELATARGSADIDLTGNDSDNWLNGNSGSNVLTGLVGNDRLQGGGGNDTLDGGVGNDVLFGNAGIDRFVFADGDGTDVIRDFEAGEIIDLSGTSAAGFDDLDIFDAPSGANIDYGTGVVVISGMAAEDLDASHFVFS